MVCYSFQQIENLADSKTFLTYGAKGGYGRQKNEGGHKKTSVVESSHDSLSLDLSIYLPPSTTTPPHSHMAGLNSFLTFLGLLLGCPV